MGVYSSNYRLQKRFSERPPISINRKTREERVYLEFVLEPGGQFEKTTSGAWRPGKHWHAQNTTMQRDFFLPTEEPWGSTLRARMRDMRMAGIGAKLAAKLVLEQYYREG